MADEVRVVVGVTPQPAIRTCNNYECRVVNYAALPYPPFQTCPVCGFLGTMV